MKTSNYEKLHEEALEEWGELRGAWLRLAGACSMSPELQEQAQQALEECEARIKRIERLIAEQGAAEEPSANR